MASKGNVRDIIMGDNVFKGTNFADWEMNLKIVLGAQRLLYTIQTPLPPRPTEPLELELWKTHSEDCDTAQAVMLASMTQHFRRQNRDLDPYNMMARLQDLHRTNERMERYELVKKLFRARMTEGALVEAHGTQMIADIDELAKMGIVLEAELTIDILLQSLPDSWRQVIINYKLMDTDDTLGELLSMLKESEKELQKGAKREAHYASTSHGPRAGPKATGGVKKRKHKNKGKGKLTKASGKPRDKSQDVCLKCGKKGHWKRECRVGKGQREDIKAGKAPASGMFVIEINMTTSSLKNWIFDSGCAAHICTDLQDL